MFQVIRGPLSQRKEEIRAVKTVPTPKPRKSVTESTDNGGPAGGFNFVRPNVAPKPVPRANSNNPDNEPSRPVAVRRSLSLRSSNGEEATNGNESHSNGSASAGPATVKRSDSDRSQKNGNGATGEDEDVFLRTPTTAQRRQIFQARINSVQESGTNVVDSASITGASPLPKRATRVFGKFPSIISFSCNFQNFIKFWLTV